MILSLFPRSGRSLPGLRLALICVLVVFFARAAQAQTVFKAVLINKADSTVITYAAVSVVETGEGVLTDTNGTCQFIISKETRQFTIRIAAIGGNSSVSYKYPFRELDTIYVDLLTNPLSEVAIKGLSAEDVVRKAMVAVPSTYADSSYFDYSFYRRYQKVNGRFVNLFEARPVVMFRLKQEKHKISVTEAFAVTQLRRSVFHPNIMNAAEDNPVDLLLENPIYHLESGFLDPSKYACYSFSFDTNQKTRDYVINYVCNTFSSDRHGLPDYATRDLKGEAWDLVTLVIDRESFAVKRLGRKSIRHQDYAYKYVPYPNNRTIYAHHDYFFEFTGGDLEAEYGERNGKWYLKKIFRQYTNEFYIPAFNTREFLITDNFEWYSDSVSRYTSDEYANKFYVKLATAIHSYDASFWATLEFPFHYFNRDEIYQSLLKDGPLDAQFISETKVDQYVKKPVKK